MKTCAWKCTSLLMGALTVPLAGSAAHAQDNYPGRTIRIIVPTGPGAGNDLQARLIAQQLSERVGQPVVIDNRVGAATIIGSEIVARAPADGYTLLMNVSTLAINPAAYKKVPYDALRDFAPITQTVSTPNVVVVNPSLPVRSLKEFIALAKARPGDIFYGTGGHGTNPHMTMELLAAMGGVRLTHVPYKGGPLALSALLGGEVAVNATSIFETLPHVRTGKLRNLGVTSARRVAIIADVPTIAEGGLPGYESVQWSGLLAPARTPREIIEKLNREVVAILNVPALRERLEKDGNEIVASSPETFAAFMKAETEKWAQVAKAANIRPE